ncbi:MAG: helix-turn-helix transcriptional regulator [Comamonas sp.]
MSDQALVHTHLDAVVHTLAHHLQEARARSNWSTRALSEHTHVDRRTIQRIEEGAFPGISLRSLETLANGLGVRTHSLVGTRLVMRRANERPAAEVLREHLVRARAMRNLTQHGLAAASGVPRSVIAALETGQRNPALSTLVKLAHGLDTTLSHLLDELDESSQRLA